MTPRERYIRTLHFQTADRVPLVEWPIRGATMARWLKEGYPEGVESEQYFHLDRYAVGVPIDTSMRPRFEEKVLSLEGNYKIWQDDLGAIRKDFANTEHPGFVTRSWLKFAVHDRASFMEMTKRYDPADVGRLAPDLAAAFETLNRQPMLPAICASLTCSGQYGIGSDLRTFAPCSMMIRNWWRICLTFSPTSLSKPCGR